MQQLTIGIGEVAKRAGVRTSAIRYYESQGVLPEPARVYFRMVTQEYPDTVWVAEAELGLAMCDVRQGRRDEAIEQLKGIEERYTGKPIAEKAARERKRLERS